MGTAATRRQRKQHESTHTEKKLPHALSFLFSHAHTHTHTTQIVQSHVKQEGNNDFTWLGHTDSSSLIFSPFWPMGGNFHENNLLLKFPVESSCTFCMLQYLLYCSKLTKLDFCFQLLQNLPFRVALHECERKITYYCEKTTA